MYHTNVNNKSINIAYQANLTALNHLDKYNHYIFHIYSSLYLSIYIIILFF